MNSIEEVKLIKTTSSIAINPESESIIQVQCQLPNTKDYIFEPSTILIKDFELTCSETLTNGNQNPILLHVIKPTKEHVKISTGIVLGEINEVVTG